MQARTRGAAARALVQAGLRGKVELIKAAVQRSLEANKLSLAPLLKAKGAHKYLHVDIPSGETAVFA